MIIKIKKKAIEQSINIFLVVSVLALLFFGLTLTSENVVAANISNNTVIARVNVTNTEPNITDVRVDDDTTNPAAEIDLVPNSVKIVTCNATVFEYNGAGDINASAVNATFYIKSLGREGGADNNTRYLNESCGRCTPDSTNPSLTYCDCRFAVQYYANDSSNWACNITVRDIGGTAANDKVFLNDSEISNTTRINKLLAINTTTLLDFGNLSVTQTSGEITHNVTNGGNINLNLTLRNFGGTNDSIDAPGNNYSMLCTLGNITHGYMRYVLGSDWNGTPYNDMRNTSNSTVRTNLTLFSRVDDTNYGNDRNSTLWRIQIPLTVGGLCNGTIIFGAIEHTP